MLKKEQLILELIEKNINTKANTYIENLSILLGMMVGKDYNRYIQDIEKDTFNSNLDEKIPFPLSRKRDFYFISVLLILRTIL